MNDFYEKLLIKIEDNIDNFKTLISLDNALGNNFNIEDIINFLKFPKDFNFISDKIIGNILITEGDIFTIIKLLQKLSNLEGNYILYINNFNEATNSFLVMISNKIYKEMNKNINITIDYDQNYNKYLNEMVNIIGSEEFVNTAKKDFSHYNEVII